MNTNNVITNNTIRIVTSDAADWPQSERPVLSITKNGKTQQWITVIEDGIPVWVLQNNTKKHELMGHLEQLFNQAVQNDDDEPVIRISCKSGVNYLISYFPYATLYLCEELEGRYATLSTLTDALWELVCEQTVTDYTLL